MRVTVGGSGLCCCTCGTQLSSLNALSENSGSGAAVPLLAEVTTEEKTEYRHGLTRSHVLLKTTNYSRKKHFTHHDHQHRLQRGDRKIANGNGSLGQ